MEILAAIGDWLDGGGSEGGWRSVMTTAGGTTDRKALGLAYTKVNTHQGHNELIKFQSLLCL